jgi:hypothetical protein
MIESPFLELIIQACWDSMSNPVSAFYLPKILKNQEKNYDPLLIKKEMFLKLPDSHKNACLQKGNIKGICFGTPDLTLYNLYLSGLYNVLPGLIKPEITNEETVSAFLDFSKIKDSENLQPQIELNCNFNFKQWCCMSVSETECDPEIPKYLAEGNGTIKIIISASQGFCKFDLIRDNDKLKVEMKQLKFIVIDLNKGKNFCIDINTNNLGRFNFLPNKAANTDLVRHEVLNKINELINEPDSLKSFGLVLSEQINSIFKKKSNY